jgi:hypothetical protein
MRTRLLLSALVGGLSVAAVSVAIGQSVPKGDPGAMSAVLTGAKEVDAQTLKKGGGDADGFGSAQAIVSGKRLCYSIVLRSIKKPIAAHIHRGGSSAAGPVVINLKQPKSRGAGASAACITPKRKEATALAALKRNPKGHYFNVHTSDHASGAIRGQISPKKK